MLRIPVYAPYKNISFALVRSQNIAPHPFFVHLSQNMSAKMRAVLIKNGKGTADDLYIGEYDKPSPTKGEVLVKIKATGLNRMDIMQRKGGYPLPPQANKDILGVEFSGTVEELGEGVSNFKVGDEVFGLAYGGAYAEYINAHSSMLMPKPACLNWHEAAAVPEAWFTAYKALVLVGGLSEGKSVLIHAGASGVGVAANQIARFLGAKHIFTTAGSDEKIKFLNSMPDGPTQGINYKTQDFAEEIDKATNGDGVDLVIDFVGKDYWARNIKVLKRDGRMVLLATLSGNKIPELDLGQIIGKRLRIEGSTLRSRSPEFQANLVSRFSKEILPYLKGQKNETGPLKVYIHEVFSWKNVAEAHKEMEADKNSGKIILDVD